jgi:hypothetical protein
MTNFSIGVLCYGNYPDLAQRCLTLLTQTVKPGAVKDLRICLNQCGHTTKSVVYDLVKKVHADVPVYVYTTEPHAGIPYKYPIMRMMLYHSFPVQASHWMWFDDDVHLRLAHSWKDDWLETLASRIDSSSADYAGYLRGSPAWRPGQIESLKQQLWYRGKEIKPARCQFFQGGWWVARTSLLKDWNYPFPQIIHNGGDTVLGQLAYQQDWMWLTLDEKYGPVVVDIEKRRGNTTTWPWQVGAPTSPDGPFEHQRIRMKVERFNDVPGSLSSDHHSTHQAGVNQS